MYFRFIQISLLTISLAINGCVSTHMLKPNKKIKNGNGVAVIALVNDKSIVTSMIGEIGYRKLGSKQTHYLSAENDYNPFDNDFKYIKGVRGRVLAVELPAGQYALTNWTMANYATKAYIIPKKVEPIYFSIKPHTVTYLGHYFFKTKFNGKNLFGFPVANGGKVIISNQYHTDITIAKRKYPNIKIFPVIKRIKQVSSWEQNRLN